MTSFDSRLSYSAIVDRPPLKLPDGKRMAVWTIVNVEEWDPAGPMPRTVLPPPMGQPMLPDLPNWAWHQYGMRVGFWRVADCLARFGVTATFAVNGIVCRAYPRIAAAARAAGWEFMGHGWAQGPMHRLDDQRAAIRETVAAIAEAAGAPPRGWESPGLTETETTLDILAEEGIEYVAEWVLDDQPVELQTTAGPIVSVPYTLEVNDVTMMALQQHDAAEMLRRGVDQFDRLYQESTEITRVMAISLHPYLSGAPHRIRYIEELYAHIARHKDVALMTGAEILDWYRGQRAG